jgi:hypothetical protein
MPVATKKSAFRGIIFYRKIMGIHAPAPFRATTVAERGSVVGSDLQTSISPSCLSLSCNLESMELAELLRDLGSLLKNSPREGTGPTKSLISWKFVCRVPSGGISLDNSTGCWLPKMPEAGRARRERSSASWHKRCARSDAPNARFKVQRPLTNAPGFTN